MGHRFEDLDAVDRLALVGTKGRGTLVFQPETLGFEASCTIDLDALAAEDVSAEDGDDADPKE